MKRIIAVVFIIIMIFPLSSLAGQEIFQLRRVYYPIEIDGKEAKIENPILNYNGSTYVPLKWFSQITLSGVNWDKDNNKVNISTLKDGVVKLSESMDPEEDSSIDNELLKSAQENLEINGHKYHLETTIYRNFMPGKTILDKALEGGVTVFVVEDTGEKFSQFMDIQDSWFVYKGKAWKMKFLSAETVNCSKGIIALAKRSPSFPTFANNTGSDSNGVRIDPDAGKVDVVVKIVDKNNKTFFLKAKNQPIAAAS
ncbi:MAG: stalk domain-containing protein [Bacillota bacterium]|nr:stalk domain-containing protein [Bacillota bacterium]